MSKLGYGFESEIEDAFLELTGQNKQTALLRFDDRGFLMVNRSFRIPNSGAMESLKGDIITCLPWLKHQLKVECKARYTFTKKDGQMIIVQKEWVEKNEEEAAADHQVPVLTFSFKRVQKHRIWWLLSEPDYFELSSAALTAFKEVPLVPTFSKKDDSIKFVYKELNKEENTALRYTDKLLAKDYMLLSHESFFNLIKRLKEQRSV